MSCRLLFLLAAAFGTPSMNLIAKESMRFDFLADSRELMVPTQVVAPDFTGLKPTQDIILLSKVEHGVVQCVDNLGVHSEVAARVSEVLKTWRFTDTASGHFLLLGKSDGPFPASIHGVESLDNRPGIRVKAVPSYPRLLRPVLSWKASVEVVVNPFGTPVAANVLTSSGADFAESATLAALLCRFDVGRKNGEAVFYKTNVEISFCATQ
jgi:hypothetical protein